MSLFNTRTFTVTRKAAGTYVKGIWSDGATSTFSASGSLQPVSAYTAKALLEGSRLTTMQEFITGTKLIATDPLTQITGDTISIDNEIWVVIKVDGWQNGILPHYSCFITRKDEVPA